MSAKLWNRRELEEIKSGSNPLQSTIFMNKKTFSEYEMSFYPYSQRRTFQVWFDDATESIKVYAVNESSLFEFLKLEYDVSEISYISEEITNYVEIEIPEEFLITA